MDYNLQKLIEPSFMRPLSTDSSFFLTPFPATDYINPGIGNIVRLYSFYEQSHGQTSTHSIEKTTDQLDQTGSGETETY
jgi:hypothetical protein